MSTPDWVRRRRLDEAFGDSLPEQTGDDVDFERSSGRGEPTGEGKGDDWYREQVPPHHG